MFKIIDGLADDVLGIEISGKLTHEDYINGFIPLFDEKLEKHEPLKVICVIGDDFNGMELAAMWDDATYGIKHWRDISHMAVVSDMGWMKSMMAVFSPFYPGELRSYSLAELDKAKDWVSTSDELAA